MNIEMTESIRQIFTMIANGTDPQNAPEAIKLYLQLFESNLQKYHQVMAIEILTIFREEKSEEFIDRFKDVYQEFAGTNFLIGKINSDGIEHICRRYVNEMWKYRKEFLNAVQEERKIN